MGTLDRQPAAKRDEMNTIDHTTAEFDLASLTRGYASASKDRTIVHCRKVSDTQAHFIVSDTDGFYEFTAFNRNSAKQAAQNTADSI